MQTIDTPRPTAKKPARRVGYSVAAAVNLILIVVVNSLMNWGWPPFLTDDFARVLPLMNLSLGAAVLVNLAYLSYDPPRFQALCRMFTGVLSLAATGRMWVVFPFDFSTSFDWAMVVRVILILAMVGTAIAILTDFFKWLTGASTGEV